MNQNLSKWFFRGLLILSVVITIWVIIEGDYELILPLMLSLWGYKKEIKETILGIDNEPDDMIQYKNMPVIQSLESETTKFENMVYSLVDFIADERMNDNAFQEINEFILADFEEHKEEIDCYWCGNKGVYVKFTTERAKDSDIIDEELICLECFTNYVEGYIGDENLKIKD